MNPIKKLLLLLVIYIEAVILSIRSRYSSSIATGLKIDARFERLEQKLKIINSK